MESRYPPEREGKKKNSYRDPQSISSRRYIPQSHQSIAQDQKPQFCNSSPHVRKNQSITHPINIPQQVASKPALENPPYMN